MFMATTPAKKKTETKKKEKTTKKAEAVIEGVQLPLKFIVPENIITRYANNVVVQLLENEFKISFFETNPEIKFNRNDIKQKEVETKCVASIIMSPAKLPSFIGALLQQKDLYTKIVNDLADKANIKISSPT